MQRLFISTVIGILLGIGVGGVIGWGVAPAEYVNNPIANLDQQYKDDYTLMIASGYLVDGDINGAVERLRVLDVDNVFAYVQDTTERFITNSRNVTDIRKMVALSEGMGRLTPPMENFRQLSPPQETPTP